MISRFTQGQVDRATCTTDADERPVLPTTLRCSRNASVARPPFDGTRSDTVSFVSSPLAVPFPAKCAISVCLKIAVQSSLNQANSVVHLSRPTGRPYLRVGEF